MVKTGNVFGCYLETQAVLSIITAIILEEFNQYTAVPTDCLFEV